MPPKRGHMVSLKGTAQGPPDLLDHLLLPPGLLLGLLHLGHILRSPRGQKGTLMQPRPVPQPLNVHTFQRMTQESLAPVRARSSSRLQCSPQTLSSWASRVFTHSLFLMVQSFRRPSEPLGLGSGGVQSQGPACSSPPPVSLARSPGQQLGATAHEGHLQHRSVVPLECLQGGERRT